MGQRVPDFVAPQVGWVMVGRMLLVDMSVEEVEAVPIRSAFGAGTTQPPLVDKGGGIPVRF